MDDTREFFKHSRRRNAVIEHGAKNMFPQTEYYPLYIAVYIVAL